MREREKFFSEHRTGDYRIARSMKEVYGYEPTLWTQEKRTRADTADKIVFWVSVCSAAVAGCSMYFWR